jgi:hemoglobin/transferrin/lactoferrin receptor protein
MKHLYMAISAMLLSHMAFSQIIQITDQSTLQTLSGVAIYSEPSKLNAMTDQKGEADMTAFKKEEKIILRSIGYMPLVLSIKELEAMAYRIKLQSSSLKLDEVVVSANRFEEKVADVPQQIQVIKAKDLAFMNQQTTADVLQNSGNVMVQKSQGGGGSPIIRGFETNKVLMVVDGVRMNNAIYRGGHLQNIITLDNANMEKIELVFGPGSVMYGSDALGGVMHFYTKNPILTQNDKMAVNANAFLRFSSANGETSGHADVSIGGKKFGSFSSFTYSNFNDLRQGAFRSPFYGDWGKRPWYVKRINDKDSIVKNDDFNLQKGSGYSQYDLLQKFLFKQSEAVSHTINLQFSNSSNIPRYDRLTLLRNGKARFGDWYYGPQKRLFGSYTLALKRNTGIYDDARIILGYQNIEESRYDRNLNSNSLNQRIEQLDILTFNMDFSKQIKRHEIRYGAEIWTNDVNSKASTKNILDGTEKPLDTRYPDGGSSMQSAAVYLSHAYEINEKWIINEGVRVNYIALDAKFNDTTFFPFPFKTVEQKNTALTGNVGITFKPNANWKLSLLGASGFRAPNVDDLSKVFESVPGKITVPNPNIKPEYTYNLDFSISKSFNNKVHLGGTGYYTWYRDAITIQSAKFNGQDSIVYGNKKSKVVSATNASKAYIYGFSAFLNADVTSNFSITNSINYTFGRIKTDTTDYPLDHIPPVFGKTAFLLKLPKFTGEFFVLYSHAKTSKDYNLVGEDNASYSADAVKGYMPGWLTLNIRTAYQATKNISVQLAVENLMDQHYRVFSSNIGAPGRNIMMTIRGTF